MAGRFAHMSVRYSAAQAALGPAQAAHIGLICLSLLARPSVNSFIANPYNSAACAAKGAEAAASCRLLPERQCLNPCGILAQDGFVSLNMALSKCQQLATGQKPRQLSCMMPANKTNCPLCTSPCTLAALMPGLALWECQVRTMQASCC